MGENEKLRAKFITDVAEREAMLGLWAVPGLGPAAIDAIAELTGEHRSVAPLLDEPVKNWARTVELKEKPKAFLDCVDTLRVLAGRIRELAAQKHYQIAFPGDPDYPERLLEIRDYPRVLFHYGKAGAPRRRAAIVGARAATQDERNIAGKIASELAEAGFGIVSGGAMGIDDKAHRGALAVQGETWVWLASSLDEMDAGQREICKLAYRNQGMVLTEYPPHTRSRPESFPRRNRLVSGSSDVVIVVRADQESGTVHTIEHALKQGRQVFVVPSNAWSPANWAGNGYLASGQARACRNARDVLDGLGVEEKDIPKPKVGQPLEELRLSANAKTAFGALDRHGRVFDEILETTSLDSSALVSALTELELKGLAVQHPGKIYERA